MPLSGTLLDGSLLPQPLTAADELHHDSHISDKTWAGALAARYDEKHQIELPILVGQHHMVAFALNSLGVEIEPGF
jgi:hypothetical protein